MFSNYDYLHVERIVVGEKLDKCLDHASRDDGIASRVRGDEVGDKGKESIREFEGKVDVCSYVSGEHTQVSALPCSASIQARTRRKMYVRTPWFAAAFRAVRTSCSRDLKCARALSA